MRDSSSPSLLLPPFGLSSSLIVFFLPFVQMLPSNFFCACSVDASNIHYFGNSYLEFEGFELEAINTITVSFQSQAAQGTIIYVDQGPANGDFFFMKLFILEGALQVTPTQSFGFFFFFLICAGSNCIANLSRIEFYFNALRRFSTRSAATKRKPSHRSARPFLSTMEKFML